jgi:hypothetical protein
MPVGSHTVSCFKGWDGKKEDEARDMQELIANPWHEQTAMYVVKNRGGGQLVGLNGRSAIDGSIPKRRRVAPGSGTVNSCLSRHFTSPGFACAVPDAHYLPETSRSLISVALYRTQHHPHSSCSSLCRRPRHVHCRSWHAVAMHT